MERYIQIDFGSELTLGERYVDYIVHYKCSVTKPMLLPHFAENEILITKISCGQTDSLALDGYGNVYVWGASKFGACGWRYTNGLKQVSVPGLVKGLNGYVIIDIKASMNHSFAKSDRGLCWVWGENHYGQLNLKRKDEKEICNNICEPFMISDRIKMENKNEKFVIEDVYFGYGVMYVVGTKKKLNK